MAFVLAAAMLLGACDREDDRVAAPPGGGSVTGVVTDVPLAPGPGFASTIAVSNPYADDSDALAEGQRWYVWYNCDDCHGELGGGGMGPPLRDDDWIYGGDDVSIYRSIMEGRPEGMPAWQGMIPEDQGWKIVAYIRSLGSGVEYRPALSAPADRTPPFEEGPTQPGALEGEGEAPGQL